MSGAAKLVAQLVRPLARCLQGAHEMLLHAALLQRLQRCVSGAALGRDALAQHSGCFIGAPCQFGSASKSANRQPVSLVAWTWACTIASRK